MNAHGYGSVPHDRAEALAIRETLGDVPVTAPKSYFGNLGAARAPWKWRPASCRFPAESCRQPSTTNSPILSVRFTWSPNHSRRSAFALMLNQATTGQALAVIIEAVQQ